MLQFEEWFRRSMRRPERKAAPVTRPAASAVHRPADVCEKDACVQAPETVELSSLSDAAEEMFEPEDIMTSEPVPEPETEDTKEPEQIPAAEEDEGSVQAQENVVLQDSVVEADELEHISEQIGQDVTDMIDMKKEDFLLQQIDEFREKAKQLQQGMVVRVITAEHHQHLRMQMDS